MSPDEWQAAIDLEAARLPPPIEAETFHEKLPESYSKPVVVFGNDKRKYILKGMLTAHPERVVSSRN